MGPRAGSVRIGISGWRYPPWRGDFYPSGLPQRSELAYASARLSSIELNGSFYSLQQVTSYHAWYAQTPPGFVLSLKAPRYISHMLRLRGARTALANFFASGVLALEEKTGPVLWQLPATYAYDADALTAFFEQLPRTTSAAARLSLEHDERMQGRSHTVVSTDRPLRYALEVRSPTFLTEQFAELMRAHDIAVVVADTAGRWPFIDTVTSSSLVYVRLHGDKELYVSGYDDEALDRWAARVREWAAGGRDVYVYFDNDVKVRAPYDAMALAERLGVRPPQSD